MSIDFLARELAVGANKERIGAAARRYAFRIFGGRVAGTQAVSTSNLTFETIVALACPADAVRLVYCFGQTAATTAIPVRAMSHVASIGSISEAAIQSSESDMQLATTNGSTTPLMGPASNAARHQFYRSDWIAAPSVDRTDGAKGSLYAIRTTLFTDSGSGDVVLMGNGSDDFANWAAHPGGRHFRAHSKLGVSSSNWSGFTDANSNAEKLTLVVGIE